MNLPGVRLRGSAPLHRARRPPPAPAGGRTPHSARGLQQPRPTRDPLPPTPRTAAQGSWRLGQSVCRVESGRASLRATLDSATDLGAAVCHPPQARQAPPTNGQFARKHLKESASLAPGLGDSRRCCPARARLSWSRSTTAWDCGAPDTRPAGRPQLVTSVSWSRPSSPFTETSSKAPDPEGEGEGRLGTQEGDADCSVLFRVRRRHTQAVSPLVSGLITPSRHAGNAPGSRARPGGGPGP